MTASFGSSALLAIPSRPRGQENLLDDHLLMGRVADGDTVAFEVLTRRHLAVMIAVAERILGNAGEADEVAQEAFLRLWINAPKWDPDGPGSVKTWLSRVVTNLCLDRYRRRRSVPLESIGDIEDVTQRTAEKIGEQDSAALVRDMLKILPERQRIAVVLSYFEELSGREVAQAMDLTIGAVESLLVRARRSLRDEASRRGLKWGEDV